MNETSRVTPLERFVAWAGIVLLLVLHLDFWRAQRPELYFGWMPEDMAYRLVWMVLAWGYLVFFTRRIWGRRA